MPDLTTADFLKQLSDLSPGIRDGIITNGLDLLREFDFTGEQLSQGIQDNQQGIHAALQGYFCLYLWQLKLIDDSFIKAVSQANAADPQAYEKIKTQFLQIIKDIPIAMIEPIVKMYYDKVLTLIEKKRSKTKAIAESLTQEQLESETPLSPKMSSGRELYEIQFTEALIQLIENIKLMIKTDLHSKIEGSFEREKAKFLNNLSQALKMSPDHPDLVLITNRMNDVYRDWAENKEQRFDEQGRSLMTFLTTGGARENPSLENDPVVLSMTKSFTPQYNQKKESLLPIQILQELHRILREVQIANNDPALTMDQQSELLAMQYVFDLSLKGYIRVLEHANRLVFSVQQLGEVNVEKFKLKKGK